MTSKIEQIKNIVSQPMITAEDIRTFLTDLQHNNYRFTKEEQYLLMEFPCFGGHLMDTITIYGYCFTFDELMEPPLFEVREKIALNQARNGYFFSVEQILFFGDPSDADGTTISLWQAKNNYHFTLEEILKLRNPADKIGATVAHWMAFLGHSFSVNELLKIGNDRIKFVFSDLIDKNNTAYNIYFYGEKYRDAEDDFANKIVPFHQGATVAHIMAREGHQFTEEEIEQLGNPKDAAGLTIKDWMEQIKEQKPTRK
jgi:hypothetical protein